MLWNNEFFFFHRLGHLKGNNRWIPRDVSVRLPEVDIAEVSDSRYTDIPRCPYQTDISRSDIHKIGHPWFLQSTAILTDIHEKYVLTEEISKDWDILRYPYGTWISVLTAIKTIIPVCRKQNSATRMQILTD